MRLLLKFIKFLFLPIIAGIDDNNEDVDLLGLLIFSGMCGLLCFMMYEQFREFTNVSMFFGFLIAISVFYFVEAIIGFMLQIGCYLARNIRDYFE